jgi:hypothetical protein
VTVERITPYERLCATMKFVSAAVHPQRTLM